MKTFPRAERIGDEIRNALSRALLTEVSDPRLSTVNITSVALTEDLRNARVYWTQLVAEPDPRLKTATERSLARAAGFLRKYVADHVELKYVPNVTWHFDESSDRGRRIDAILATILPTSAEPVAGDEGDESAPADAAEQPESPETAD